MSSLWLIGERAASATPHAFGPQVWDLVLFADDASLRRVRSATHLHRHDVRLRVVTDGDRFAAGWGEAFADGSLFQWEWRESGASEAYYCEARWREPPQAGLVERTRRRALCLWRSA